MRFDLCKFTRRVYYPVILIVILNVKCNEAIFTRTLMLDVKKKSHEHP